MVFFFFFMNVLLNKIDKTKIDIIKKKPYSL